MGHVTGRVWLAVLVTGVLCSAVGFTLQLWGQRRIEPARAAVILLFETAFGHLRRYLVLFITTRTDVKLWSYTFDKVLNLPIDYFERSSTGEFIQKFHEMGKIRNFLTTQLFGTALDAYEVGAKTELLDHRLRSCLLPRRLMLRLKLHLAALADSDHRNILDAFHDAKIAFSHRYSLPQFPWYLHLVSYLTASGNA